MLKKIIAYGCALLCTFASQAATQENPIAQTVKQPEFTIEQITKQMMPQIAQKLTEYCMKNNIKPSSLVSPSEQEIEQVVKMLVQKMLVQEKKSSLTKTLLIIGASIAGLWGMCAVIFYIAATNGFIPNLSFEDEKNKQ